MFPIALILALFLYQVSAGCMAALALMPLKHVDRKFYQLTSGLSTILVMIALFLTFYYPFVLPEGFGVAPERYAGWLKVGKGMWIAYFFVTTALYFRMRWQKLGAAKALVRVSAGLGVLSLMVEGLALRPERLYGGLNSALLPVDVVTASLFLGVFFMAMVFGHWYLVQAMPKSLLKRMTEILFVLLVLRVLVVGGVLLFHYFSVAGGAATIHGLMDIAGGHGLFFWQRILIGLGIPLILSYMIWSTAKMGANQSATGLLYVGVVFVIIGEMISKYLFIMTGIPI